MGETWKVTRQEVEWLGQSRDRHQQPSPRVADGGRPGRSVAGAARSARCATGTSGGRTHSSRRRGVGRPTPGGAGCGWWLGGRGIQPQVDLDDLHPAVAATAGPASRGRASDRGCRQLWEAARWFGGGLNLAKSIREPETCITGMLVLLAASFGHDDPRLDPTVEWLLGQQLNDGGWNCESIRSGSRHGSFHTSITVLEALCAYEQSRGSAVLPRPSALSITPHR